MGGGRGFEGSKNTYTYEESSCCLLLRMCLFILFKKLFSLHIYESTYGLAEYERHGQTAKL